MNDIYGKLYIVATPIGNMQDITIRALDVLKKVDFIASEDTRNTIKILNHYEIKTKLVAYHKFNENEKAIVLVNEMKKGKNVALVTDAGTPLISDPGYVLVNVARNENINVTSIPGPCALINGLVLSGMDTREFCFIGFLSNIKKEREKKLNDIKNETRTMIFYVSPHKLREVLLDMSKIFEKNRRCSLIREMTKKYEEVLNNTIEELVNIYEKREIKGEFVLCVEGAEKSNIENKFNDISIEEHFNIYIEKGFSSKEAMKKVAKDRQIDKSYVYNIIKKDN